FKKLFFLQFFPRAEQERLKREYHSIRQTNTETCTEFMQRFLRLAGSTINHLMCMSYTDVAQVANAARNYEILHERDDDDTERPDKRQKSGDRHQPTTQQSSHRNHVHNNNRHGSDRRGGGDNHRSNNNYSGNNNRNSGNGRDQRNRGQQSNRSANFEHHVTIDCRSYRVIFGDIHAPEFIYHGSLQGKSMQIISALQARTLLSRGCEGFQATIHDTTSYVPSIHDQPIVSEFPDVFPDELPGIPPVREVEFNIELILGAEPISKAPYR
nr:putative reverse transcriptase domain, aspartic peptidase domain protein [Tanacetum cinerariifolium]